MRFNKKQISRRRAIRAQGDRDSTNTRITYERSRPTGSVRRGAMLFSKLDGANGTFMDPRISWAYYVSGRLRVNRPDTQRMPGVCRVYGPDGTLKATLDPFTRAPVAGTIPAPDWRPYVPRPDGPRRRGRPRLNPRGDSDPPVPEAPRARSKRVGGDPGRPRKRRSV